MLISQEIQNRIIESAEQLYAQHPDRLPTVADVRALSKADMNSVSTVMKQWRQGKLMPQRTIEENAPSEILSEAKALASSIWATARAQAEQKLHEAEAQYMKEREEAEQLRLELSLECDTLQKVIDEQVTAISQLQQTQQQAEQALNRANETIVQLQAEKGQALHQEALATAKNIELEKHIVTLKTDLEHTQTQAVAEAQAHTQTIIELQQALAALERSSTQLQTRLEQETQTCAQLRLQYEQQQAENASLAKAMKEQQSSEKNLLERLATAEKVLGSAQSELQTAKAVTEQAQKHAQDLQMINAGLLKLNK